MRRSLIALGVDERLHPILRPRALPRPDDELAERHLGSEGKTDGQGEGDGDQATTCARHGPPPHQLQTAPGLGGRGRVRRPHPTATATGGRRWSLACATFWHPQTLRTVAAPIRLLPPTPRDRRDVARPSNATGSSPHDDDGQAKDQLTPALSRTGLRPVGDHGRGPAEAAAPASAPVAGPVVGFGSWSDPDPDAAADPDPPPGTQVLPGHHSRAGHSRARLNGQHPGRGPAPAGVRFATRPPRHSAEPRSSQRCWWADDPAGDRDCFWPGGVRGELMRIPTRCADGRGHPGGAPDQPDHTAGRAGARTGDLNRRGGV